MSMISLSGLSLTILLAATLTATIPVESELDTDKAIAQDRPTVWAREVEIDTDAKISNGTNGLYWERDEEGAKTEEVATDPAFPNGEGGHFWVREAQEGKEENTDSAFLNGEGGRYWVRDGEEANSEKRSEPETKANASREYEERDNAAYPNGTLVDIIFTKSGEVSEEP